jgi:hypothetical protein
VALKAFLYGVAGGAVVGGVVWWFASRSLKAELSRGGAQLLIAVQPELQSEIRSTLDAEVPRLVQASLRSELARYGIDPATGQRINQALTLLERTGVL